MTTMTLTQTPQRSELAATVRAAQRGDRAAMGRLVERFEHLVYATAMRRLHNHAEAQELSQEVFVKALQKIDQLRVPEAFVGWLRSIADRMAINRAVRRAPTVATEPQVLEAKCVSSQTPLGSALDAERGRQVREGLDRLGALDRDTLMAFYMDGRSIVEMSDQFDSPVGTIKRRLHVARNRLKKQLAHMAAV